MPNNQATRNQIFNDMVRCTWISEDDTFTVHELQNIVTNTTLSMFGIIITYILFEVVFWFSGISGKQWKDIACHVKLQLHCTSFVELVSKDQLQQQQSNGPET